MPPPLILFYNRFFGEWPEVPERCSTDVQFTTDPAAWDDADAVVFHVPTVGAMEGLRKRAHQLWVAWSMESKVTCPRLADPEFMGRFDLRMTYERSSDVWAPYFGPDIADALRAPVTPRIAEVPVVYVQSNPYDRCGRVAFAAEVMRRVKVHSFGRVLNNQQEAIPPGHQGRVDLYRRYKFTLAFENSFAPDYVTEKLFEPLIAGSVPVYRGTPDAAELAPAPDCYVDAGRFGSGTELGAYLNHLDMHDDEYLAYHAWRARPWSSTFRSHLERLRGATFCRLAAAVAALSGAPPR